MRLVPPLRRFSRLLIGDAARVDELVEAALLRILALDIASACAPGLRLMLFKRVVGVQARVRAARHDLAHRMAAPGRQGIESGRAVAHL